MGHMSVRQRRLAATIAAIVALSFHAACANSPAKISSCGASNQVAPQPYFNARALAASDENMATNWDDEALDVSPNDEEVGILEQEGVTTLLCQDDGISLHQRVRILNDYGFWLTKLGRVSDGINVLKRVVELSPHRAIAWLNLGDAYRSYLPPNDEQSDSSDDKAQLNATWAERVRYTNLAVYAYRRYLRLNSKPPERVLSFLSLNMAYSNSRNVCQFVEKFSNAGRMDKIFASQMFDKNPMPVDLLGDGTYYFVYTEASNSTNIPFIFATTEAIQGQITDRLDGSKQAIKFFSSPNELKPGDSINLILYDGKYYVLRNAYSNLNNFTSPRILLPAEVVLPNKGVVCKLSPVYKQSLATNTDHDLCEKFLEDTNFDRILGNSTTPLIVPKDNIVNLIGGTAADPKLVRLAEADLQNPGQQQTIGYFEIASSSGPDCVAYGFSIFDTKIKDVVDSELNDQLLATEAQTVDCRGSASFLIMSNGKTYFESNRGSTDPGENPGESMYVVKNDQVMQVCSIDTKETVLAH